MTASSENRAARRFAENIETGTGSQNFEDILSNLNERDQIDSTRDTAPLVKAIDAISVDTDNKTIAQVLAEFTNQINYLK